MSKFSEYLQGELEILFFSPNDDDVSRVVNELIGDGEEVDVAVKDEQVLPVDTSISAQNLAPTENLIPVTPERLTQKTSGSNSMPITPSQWNISNLNFESAGFSPEETAAIKRKIANQKIIAALNNAMKHEAVNREAIAAFSTPSKTSSKATNSFPTPTSTATSRLDVLNFLVDNHTADDQAKMKHRIKLQMFMDALSTE